MGRRNVRQRVHRAYMRPQLAAIDQRAQFVELAAVLTGEDEVVAGVLAPGLDQVLRLGDVYDADDPAQLRQPSGLRARVLPPMVSNTTSTPRPSVRRMTALT